MLRVGFYLPTWMVVVHTKGNFTLCCLMGDKGFCCDEIVGFTLTSKPLSFASQIAGSL